MTLGTEVRINPSHYHSCHACGKTLVCVCSDKRNIDRATNEERRIYCVACGEIQAGMLELEVDARV